MRWRSHYVSLWENSVYYFRFLGMVRENSILALFENSQPNYLDTSLGLATMVFNLSSMRPWGSSRALGSRTVQPSTGASAVTSDIGVSHKISLIKIFKLRRFFKEI